MALYVILSRVSPEAFEDPSDFKKLADDVKKKIRKQCPDVIWRQSYMLMGRFDVLDIVESNDPRQVARAAMIIRAYGHSRTETMPATVWDEFLKEL